MSSIGFAGRPRGSLESPCLGKPARMCRSGPESARPNISILCRTLMSRSCSNGPPFVLARLAALPELQDVTGDLQAAAPRMMLKIDRDAIGRLGITPQSIDDTLYDAFGQRQVATIFGQLDQHRVILEVAPNFQEDASSLQRLYVRSATTNQLVPLSVLTKPDISLAALTVNHSDQIPSVTLSV